VFFQTVSKQLTNGAVTTVVGKLFQIKDMHILEFYIRIHNCIRKVASAKLSRQVSVTASALRATVIMFNILKPRTNFNNVACAKNYKCNWNSVALLLLKSRNGVERNLFFSGSVHVRVHKDVKNCVRIYRMLVDVHPVCERIRTSLH